MMLQVDPRCLFAKIFSQVLLGKNSSRLSLDATDVFKIIFAIFFVADIIQLLGDSSIEFIFLRVWSLSKVI